MSNSINFNELGFVNLRKELDEELILNYDVKGKNIKIKTTIPTEKKIELASIILSNSIDDNMGYFNPLRLKIVSVIEGMEYYSNLSFDYNKYNDIYNIYDILEDEGFVDILINQTDFASLFDFIEKCAKCLVKYNNSFSGFVNNLKENGEESQDILTGLFDQLKTDPEIKNFIENIMPNLG